MTEMRIEKTIYLAASPARVWAFLTKADLIAQWFNTPSADLAEGQEFELAERDTGEILCWGKVLEMRPTTFMAWDFTVGPANGHMSRVEWHLTPANGGTQLSLHHSGLPQNTEGFGLLLALDKGWHGFLNTLYEKSQLQDYRASIDVPATADAARNAIFDEMHLWWSDRVEPSEAGFKIRFNNSHLRFEFSKDAPLTWQCVDAHMIIEDVPDTEEWLGTSLLWAIEPSEGGTKITLHHKGLNENLACLDVCTRGWQHFFETSLRAHLSGEAPTPQTH